MKRWAGIVLALSPPEGDEMSSRLMTCLHPVAGRPLVWHTVSQMSALQPAPSRILLVSEVEVAPELFTDLVGEVEVILVRSGGPIPLELASLDAEAALVVDAAAPVFAGNLQRLLQADGGGWLGSRADDPAAALLPLARLSTLLESAQSLRSADLGLDPKRQLLDGGPVKVVRDRVQLAEVARYIRDGLVLNLMRAGATFVLPESVMVDVDVRIGRDTLIYPGVVLEGSTTIGEETVIGPGCRIIDSWIGSGVEMKGWNYISHTSVRNRAILEPYVRRGFD